MKIEKMGEWHTTFTGAPVQSAPLPPRSDRVFFIQYVNKRI